MITLQDCLDFCGIDTDAAEAIARQSQVPCIVAAAMVDAPRAPGAERGDSRAPVQGAMSATTAKAALQSGRPAAPPATQET